MLKLLAREPLQSKNDSADHPNLSEQMAARTHARTSVSKTSGMMQPRVDTSYRSIRHQLKAGSTQSGLRSG